MGASAIAEQEKGGERLSPCLITICAVSGRHVSEQLSSPEGPSRHTHTHTHAHAHTHVHTHTRCLAKELSFYLEKKNNSLKKSITVADCCQVFVSLFETLKMQDCIQQKGSLIAAESGSISDLWGNNKKKKKKKEKKKTGKNKIPIDLLYL